jgi:hypothetical protein
MMMHIKKYSRHETQDYRAYNMHILQVSLLKLTFYISLDFHFL